MDAHRLHRNCRAVRCFRPHCRYWILARCSSAHFGAARYNWAHSGAAHCNSARWAVRGLPEAPCGAIPGDQIRRMAGCIAGYMADCFRRTAGCFDTPGAAPLERTAAARYSTRPDSRTAAIRHDSRCAAPGSLTEPATGGRSGYRCASSGSGPYRERRCHRSVARSPGDSPAGLTGTQSGASPIHHWLD